MKLPELCTGKTMLIVRDFKKYDKSLIILHENSFTMKTSLVETAFDTIQPHYLKEH